MRPISLELNIVLEYSCFIYAAYFLVQRQCSISLRCVGTLYINVYNRLNMFLVLCALVNKRSELYVTTGNVILLILCPNVKCLFLVPKLLKSFLSMMCPATCKTPLHCFWSDLKGFKLLGTSPCNTIRDTVHVYSTS